MGVTGNTGTYYLNGLPSLYEVPNASGSNWFEGNAGNSTVTGQRNFGTGDQCLGALTSGSYNTATGSVSGSHLTTGSFNTLFGSVTMNQSATDSGNFALGYNSLSQLGIGGAGGGLNQSNVAIGYSALYQLQQGSFNISLGTSCHQMTTGVASYNICIGTQAGDNLGSGGAATQYNVLVGPNSGQNLIGGSQNNTWLGGFPGSSINQFYSIAVSAGQALIWDWNFLGNQVTSIQSLANAQDLHIYNNLDSVTAPGTWERGALSWQGTSNVFRLRTQKGGTGTVRLIAIDGLQKAGAPAAGDLPSGTMALINDTSGGATWLCYNSAGTIRKVQLT